MLSPAPSIDVHALMRGLVHELRNPLSAILTASSLLTGGQDLDEESAMLLDVVGKESRRMNHILTEFSLFVKPPVAHPELFDLAKSLRALARELQLDGTLPPNIEVRDELPSPLAVFSDPVQSQQAFQHLFTNAAQAMPGGGVLHLHCDSDDTHTIVFLDDSGAGLPGDALERAFQPFYSTKPAATGLGLSIASSLVRASGGDISIGNRPGPLEDANTNSNPTALQPPGARVRVHLPHSA